MLLGTNVLADLPLASPGDIAILQSFAEGNLPALVGQADGRLVFVGSASGDFQPLGSEATALLRFIGAADGFLPGLLGPVVGSANGQFGAVYGFAEAVFVGSAEPADERSPIFYTCVLTGADDGVSDASIQISSFTARHREDLSGYGRITAPAVNGLEENVAIRPSGEVVVTFHQGSIEEEVLRFPVEYLRIDKGSRGRSVTISGEFLQSSSSPVAYPLTGVSYVTNTNGTMRYRATARGGVRPGDRVQYLGVKSVVREVVWAVGVGYSQMEIQT
jgi:hypothetical protein